MITVRKLAIGVGALSAIASVAHAQNSSTATASGTATVIQPIAANKTSDLGFGTIVKPTAGTATVAVSAAGSRTVTGTAPANAAGVSAAAFNVVGEGGSAYSVSVPASFDITANGGTDTLTVTTSNNAGGGGTLSGSIGSTSTASFGVGGTINLTTGTASGAYTGNVTITASYN
jgi:hypothetical protein